jgi:RNA polymerase sigma factor (sigma-70 family)
MLGSGVDADDAVQETMVRAWRSLDGFDNRSSLRTWLYRIATNVCLDALADRSRRARPMEEGPVGTPDDVLETRPRTHWLEPIPDVRALPLDVDPAERLALRESIRLAFVSALQHLPAKQRASRYDVDALTSLLRDDAILSMPPYTLWLQGHKAIHTWLSGLGAGCRGSRMIPVAASGLPAFAQYRVDANGGHKAWATLTLELSGERVARMTSFLDAETLFPMFDLPMMLPG